MASTRFVWSGFQESLDIDFNGFVWTNKGRVREVDGSKTPGELALVLEETTLIAGDLVRAHRADSLILLGPEKIKSPEKAKASIARLLDLHPRIQTVLVGDGWFTFRHGGDLLRTLIQT